ncbi:MAG: bacteriophage abortive infection AbiH family protein, partial [Oscillospiraceae bacterium]|nr:bacteriophage abortive infection AbiH family protein [Oscillospiraceae bacterium]
MNITFMIGNGFDVNLGLKTKFTDFYDTYFKSELDREVPKSVKNFIQLVLKDKDKFGNLDKWSDFEKAFAENMEGSVDDVGEILEDFTIQFAEYLRKEDEKCDYSNENVLKQFEDFLFLSYNLVENLDKQKISSFYAQRARYSNNNPINDVNFINFNYTSTLNTLVKKVDEKFGRHLSEGILGQHRTMASKTAVPNKSTKAEYSIA